MQKYLGKTKLGIQLVIGGKQNSMVLGVERMNHIRIPNNILN